MKLDSEQRRIIDGILKEHDLQGKVRVFGSRVAGGKQLKPYSDLDLIVDVPLNLSQLGRLRSDFEESDLPFKVDISIKQNLTPEMLQQINPVAL